MASELNRVGLEFVIKKDEFNNSLKDINSQMKLTQSNINLSNAGMKSYGNTSDLLGDKQKALGQQMVNLSEKIKIYQDNIAKNTTRLNENKASLIELEKAKNKANDGYKEAVKLYGKESDEAKKLKTELDSLTDKYKEKDKQINNNIKSLNSNSTALNKECADLIRVQGELKKVNTEIATNSSKFIAMGKTLDNVGNGFKNVGSKVSGMGRTLAPASLAMGALIVSTSKLAMDYGETVSKIDVVFKENSSDIKAWSKTTIDQFGIAGSSALEMASNYGDIATGMGLTNKISADMSKELVGRIADLVSFKNVRKDVANTAMMGIFTGEAESLKAMGVIMTVANLQTYSLATGTKKAYDTMTDAEKVILRYNYVMEKTSNSAGDFARTKQSESNQLRISQERFKELSIEMGQNFLPLINPILEKVNGLMKGFGDLDPETKKMITNAILFGAVLAPVLGTVGMVTSGIGGIIGVVGKASTAFGAFKVAGTVAGLGSVATATAGATTAVAGTTTALAGATGGIGLLGSAGTIAGALLNPFTLGIVALAGTGYLVKKAMEEEVVPSIDLFSTKYTTTMDELGNITTKASVKISEETQTVVQAYIDLDTGVTKSLQDLYINSTKITEENSIALIGQYKAMGAQINADYEADKQKELETLRLSFENNSLLTAEEQQKMIDAVNLNYETKIATTTTQEARISEILNLASTQNRELSKAERDEINLIKENMRTNAITTLSAQETESNEILSRMKAYENRITAEQGAETVRLLNESRDKAVATANDEYNKRIAIAENMRATGGAEGARLADKLITEAERQRDGVVTSAESTRTNGINKLEESYSNLRNEVNVDTGTILTAWDKVKSWWNSWTIPDKTATVNYKSSGNIEDYKGMTKGYATGTSSVGTSGVYDVNERGYELFSKGSQMLSNNTAYLPQGTQVTNHAMTKATMQNDISYEVSRQVGASLNNMMTNIVNAINNSNNNNGNTQPIVLETTNLFSVDGKVMKKEIVRDIINEITRQVDRNNIGGGVR
ncbi:hypothetical protein KPL39_02180 [Clostridium gasigenes]|uniref:hypothetical protein n=1 Tax=Clostridium gasigenes TaxID=94869 RepID=UPI001C0AF1FA|nr:hypothetical protein [Clostridium gasigenes]MBU3135069.1 hypothetical protein [Clostridium gasigenes]